VEDKTTNNQQPAPINQNQQPWPEQTPTPTKIQYVVAQKSLNGLGGWLIFWMILFSMFGLGYTTMFFTGLANGISSPNGVLLAVFSPFMAASCIASVILIALRKKLGRLMSIATIGIVTLYSIINTIITATKNSDSKVALIIGGIFGTLIFSGLMILYFVASKRVRQTLIA
jgi:hypothetical protein